MAVFKAGTSGNPKGRPAGKTPGAKLRKAIELRAPDILQAVIESAVAGDMAAAKILLDRILPALRTQSLPVTLKGYGGTLSERADTIVSATMAGVIPADTSALLMGALANHAKIVETSDLIERLEVLERVKK